MTDAQGSVCSINTESCGDPLQMPGGSAYPAGFYGGDVTFANGFGSVTPQTNQACTLTAPTGLFQTADADARFDATTTDMLSNALTTLNRQGIVPVITSGYRPPKLQAALRNSNSPLVRTPARVSWHEGGAAVDFGPNSNEGHLEAIQAAMTQAGFFWGGTFRIPAARHFQSQPPGTSPTVATIRSCAVAAGE